MKHMNMRQQKKIISDLREADRRAGYAERDIARLQKMVNSRDQWLRKAKKEAGYSDDVSFDVVWKEVLAKAQSV